MANNEILLKLKAISDFSDVQSNVKTLQNYFSKLKLPKGITKNLDKSLEKLDSELQSFQGHLNSGFKNKSDVTGLEKSGQKIVQLFGDIERTINDIDSETLRKAFQIDTSDLEKAEKEVADIRDQIKKKLKIELETDNNGKKIRDFQSMLDNLYKTSKTKKLDVLRDAINSGDIDQIKNAVAELETYGKTLVGNASNANAFNSALSQISNAVNGIDSSKFIDLNNKLQLSQQEVEDIAREIEEKLNEAIQQLPTNINQVNSSFRGFKTEIEGAARSQQQLNNEFDQMKGQIAQFFSLVNVAQLVRRAFQDVYNTVKELDAVMTETAVVTDFSVGDMWDKLPEYTDQAKALGIATKELYAATTLYYQQGLDTNASMAAGIETMKMAKIAGMEASAATDAMTAALRGFNMEVNETNAQRVNDVYSKLAAITASDTEEIATAMSKTASIASAVGAEFENIAVFLAQGIETTRESADSIGTALKTVLARFNELTKDPAEIVEVDGEIVNANKVDAALKSVGISLLDTNRQFRDADEILLEVAQKWNTMSIMQQRYIATQAAGSRQQSRFIAMMSDYNRTMELQSAAYNAEGAAQEQYEKTLESLDSKLNQLKDAWDEFILGIVNSKAIKTGVDILTKLLDAINNLTDAPGILSGLTKSFLALGTFFAGRALINSFGKGIKESLISAVNAVKGEQEGKKLASYFTIGFKDGLKLNKINLAEGFELKTDALDKVEKELIKTKADLWDSQKTGDWDSFDELNKKLNELEAQKQNILDVNGELFFSNQQLSAANRNALNVAVADKKITAEQISLLTAKQQVQLAEAIAKKDQLKIDTLSNNAKATEIALNKGGIVGLLTRIGLLITGNKAKEAENVLTWASIKAKITETLVQAGLNTQMLAGLGIILAVVAAVAFLVFGISQIVKACKAQVEAQREANKASIEAAKTATEESDSLKELVNSIEEVNQAYENGTSTLADWRTAMQEAIGENDLGISSLDLMTKSYEELNKQIAESIALQQTEATRKVIQGVNAAKENMFIAEDAITTFKIEKGGTSNKDISHYSEEFLNIFRDQIDKDNKYTENIKIKDAEQMAQIIDALNTEISQLIEQRNKASEGSKEYNVLNQSIESLNELKSANSENYKEYADLKDSLPSDISQAISTFSKANDFNAETVKTKEALEGYKKDLSNYLESIGVYNTEEISNYIDSYLKGVGNFSELLAQVEFEESYGSTSDYFKETFSNATDDFKTKYNTFISELQENGDYQYFINIAAQIEDDDSIETIKEQVENNKKIYAAQIAQQKLDVTYNLSAALTDKDGNLSEVDSEILQAFESELSDIESLQNFSLTSGIALWGETASEQWEVIKATGTYIDQLKFINEISHQQGIVAAEAAKHQAEAIQTQLNALKAQKESLESKGELEAVNEIDKQIQNLEKTLSDFDGIINIQLQGVDGLQSTAETLISSLKGIKTGAEMIGEGFSVAAKDVEAFGALFPELLKDAQVMTDGSVKLNEQMVEAYITGDQAIVQSSVDSKVAELEATNIQLQSYLDAINRQIEMYNAFITYKEDADAHSSKNFEKWLETDGKNYGISAEEQERISKALSFEKQADEEKVRNEVEKTTEEMAENSARASNSSIQNSDAVETAWIQGWNSMGAQASDYFKLIATQGKDKYQAGQVITSDGTKNSMTTYEAEEKESKIEEEAVEGKYTFDASKFLNSQSYTETERTQVAQARAAVEQFEKVKALITKEMSDNVVLKSQLQSLANDIVNNTGKGDGKGKNSSDKKNDFEYDKYYNILKQIEVYQNARSVLEEEYSKELNQEIPNLNKLLNLQKQRLEIIEEELGLQKQLREGRIKQMQELEKANADFAKALQYDEDNEILVINEEEMEKIKNASAEVAEKFEEYQSSMESYYSDVLSADSDILDLEKEKNELLEKGKIDLDKSFNTLEKMEKSAERLKRIEEEISSITSQSVVNSNKLSEAYTKQIEELEQQKAIWEEIQKQRQQQYNKLLSSEAGQAYFDSDFVHQIEEGVFEINWDLLQNENQNTIDSVTNFIEKLNEASENINKATESVADFDQQLRDTYASHTDKSIQLVQDVRDALIEGYQKQIDKLSEANDAINDSNSKLMNSIQKNLDAERQARNNQKTEKDISDKEARLAYLQADTTGANALEIKNLQKELAEQKQDYTDTLIDQKISELQQQNDEAAAQREVQIELAQAQLDQYQNSGAINNEIKTLLENGVDANGEVVPGSELHTLLTNSADYTGMSAIEQQQYWNDINGKIASYKEILEGIPFNVAFGVGETLNSSDFVNGAFATIIKDAGLTPEQEQFLITAMGIVSQKTASAYETLLSLGATEEQARAIMEKWSILNKTTEELKNELTGIGLSTEQISSIESLIESGASPEEIKEALTAMGVDFNTPEGNNLISSINDVAQAQKDFQLATDDAGLETWATNIITPLDEWSDSEKNLYDLINGLDIDKNLKDILLTMGKLGQSMQGYKFEVGENGELLVTDPTGATTTTVTGVNYDPVTGSFTKKEGEEITTETRTNFKARHARLALRYAAKLEDEDSLRVDGFTPKAYDLDGDGKITAEDARRILRLSSKLDTPESNIDEMLDILFDKSLSEEEIRRRISQLGGVYKTGGLADFTGPAWLDGTKTKPELVLNARDTQNFIELKDILSSVLKNVGSTKKTDEKNGDTYYEIHIDVEKLSSDYDVEDVANKVKAIITQDAMYRNTNMISRLR